MLVITLPQWLQLFFREPGILLWTGFGVIPSLLVVGVIMRITRSGQLMKPIIYAFIITWPIGFLALIISVFSGIAPAKLALIWLIIFIGMLIFNIVFRRSINKFVDSFAESEKAEVQNQTTTQNKKKKGKKKR